MLSNVISVDDLENYARLKLSTKVYDYYRSGSGLETTLRQNRKAFNNYCVLPKMLMNVSNRVLTTSIAASEGPVSVVGIAPTAMQKMANEQGELATVRAAEATNSIFILSTLSTTSIEEVAHAAPNATKWFQLYVYKNRKITESLVQRAEKAGFRALVVTVDTPVFGQRTADIRNQFTLPSHLKLANFEQNNKLSVLGSGSCGSNLSGYVSELFDESLCWSDIRWLQSITKLPIMLKGILTECDALKAVECGVTAIIVSNHGARQLDSVPATIEVLSTITNALRATKCDVYMDGGIRHGTDVFKAIALGAKLVFVGRPILWALAYNGRAGIESLLRLLADQLDNTMALAGCRTIADIRRATVVHKSQLCNL